LASSFALLIHVGQWMAEHPAIVISAIAVVCFGIAGFLLWRK